MVNGGRVGYMGCGVRRPKYFTIHYRSTRSLQGNMRICQGILREKMCQSVGILLEFTLAQFYGAGTVHVVRAAMGLMQQATHPMWDYVRGRLRKQAAFTHSIENSGILDGPRHVCTNLMSYTHLYVLITTYSWDETFENDDNLKKARMSSFVGKTVKELQQFLKQRAVISSGYLKAVLLY